MQVHVHTHTHAGAPTHPRTHCPSLPPGDGHGDGGDHDDDDDDDGDDGDDDDDGIVLAQLLSTRFLLCECQLSRASM